jgi:outer membrane protein OmpA-like peptidoglycan-associated protein
MGRLPILTAVFLTAATPVFAQVTVDLHALQALPERPPANRAPRPAPPVAVSRPTVTAREAAPAAPSQNAPSQTAPSQNAAPQNATPASPAPTSAPPASATAPAPQPALPETVPEIAAINPIAPPEPPSGSAQPPPPPVSAKAETKAAPTTAGLRLSFAPDQSDLSPESTASIKQLIASAPPGDDTTFNVQAYAPGKPDDPSTARRVSLSRAMAVRSALVADGVPSARIFVRALGEQHGDGPPDRVDIDVNPSSSTATAR